MVLPVTPPPSGLDGTVTGTVTTSETPLRQDPVPDGATGYTAPQVGWIGPSQDNGDRVRDPAPAGPRT